MKKATKAQVKMFETIAVLVIFFFLIAFGLTFYMMISKSSAKKAHERFLQLQAIQTVQRLSTLPELECAVIGVQIENCFDKIKINKFSELLQTEKAKEWYYKIFGFSEITITQIFPETTTPSITLYSNKLEDKGYSFSQVPVLLYEPMQNTFSFGVVETKLYET